MLIPHKITLLGENSLKQWIGVFENHKLPSEFVVEVAAGQESETNRKL